MNNGRTTRTNVTNTATGDSKVVYADPNRNVLAPESLKKLQQAARDRENVFAQLMEAVKYNSEGQISHALYDVGGEYRRNM